MAQLISNKEIDSTYADLEADLLTVSEAEAEMVRMEWEKANIWVEMNKQEGFKPGRSNLEMDAKIMEYNPDFISRYNLAKEKLEAAKTGLSITVKRVDRIKTLIEWLKIYGE